MNPSLVLRALLVVAISVSPASALDRNYNGVKTKVVETGIGITMSVPDFWVTDKAAGNNKFVIGSREDDFTVIVTDFGLVQKDASVANQVYRESFKNSGLVVVSEAEIPIAGTTHKKFVLVLETPSGKAHVEAVMVPVGSELFAVMAVTPVALVEGRRGAIGAIFESIRVKP